MSPVVSFIHCNAVVTRAKTVGYSRSAHPGCHDIIPTRIANLLGFTVGSGLMYTKGPIVKGSV